MTDIPINDGGGLFDSGGLCDSLIVDCNNVIKGAITGNYVQCASLIVQMVQKLAKLKDGIKADLASKDKIIEELKRVNDGLVTAQTGLPVDGGN